jgi:hypothetical protein
MPHLLYKILLSGEFDPELRQKIVDVANGDLGYHKQEWDQHE